LSQNKKWIFPSILEFAETGWTAAVDYLRTRAWPTSTAKLLRLREEEAVFASHS
jgi:hypothetical protein